VQVKISIVTINLNNLPGLIKTIQSVYSQDYQNIEYLIIDGGSTDGSVDYIKSNAKRINYDAMNKGIIKSTGEYLLFLNSGDYLYEEKSLSILAGQNISEDIVFGKIGLCTNNQIEVKAYPEKLKFIYFRYDTIPHQATLIRKALFSKFGYYSTHFKIVSDWAFFVDVIFKGKATYRYVDKLISIFDMHGLSSQPSSGQLIRSEMDQHFKKKYWIYVPFFKLTWAMNYYPKRILREFGIQFD
jgi:glycosyltransferase involved in cell wall biosynthesis